MGLCELHQAVKRGDLDRVSELLSESPRTIDISLPDHKGWAPLMYAVSSTEAGIEVLRTLIRHGVNIDQTSVSLALDDPNKLALLIEAGADISYRTEKGYDALVNAAYSRNVRHNPKLMEVLQLLIANGVSVRAMTTYETSDLLSPPGDTGLPCQS